MKKLTAIILMITLVLGLAACGAGQTSATTSAAATSAAASSESTAKPAAQSYKIGFSVSTMNNPFFVTMTDAASAKAKELGVELLVVDAGDDTSKQASTIENFLVQGVKLIIINPVDSKSAAAAVKVATDAGIPVISVDRSVEGAAVVSHIASDNVLGAKMAGEYLISLVGEGAKVAELEGVPGASATNDRGTGFHQAVDGKLDVVARQTANFNRAEGVTVMENMLQAHPDIKGVFAHNDEMALGAVVAAENRKTQLAVVGFDATDDALKAVQEGRMAATVAQKPDLMGEMAVENAVRYLSGEKIEASIPVPVELITKK
jgi:ribose transport system substrate-binding protein